MEVELVIESTTTRRDPHDQLYSTFKYWDVVVIARDNEPGEPACALGKTAVGDAC